MNNNVVEKVICAIATDPIYIGTGGYTIGRVDNTIVRDPITYIPKIPGSSLAGTWRYYVAMELQSKFKDEYKKDLQKRKDKSLEDLFENPKDWMKEFDGNRYARIKCAGQDDQANKTFEDSKMSNTGHCGRCIVCKGFGFAKKDISNQGMLFFSDLNILYFPVYTRLGTKWITSPKLLNENFEIEDNTILTANGSEGYLNLGWLNLEVRGPIKKDLDLNNLDFKKEDIVIVPDSLISQIINSNLEVRTSVSIDPITGAAKEGALFTSEAIPRGTIFKGEIRGFKRVDNDLPDLNLVFNALDDTKHYYETLGIGGMTTRGFGRLKIDLK
ncbi:hypothetical protein FE773_07115 [Caminibacter mediatlanticus TB-2]|uniref:CRISPR type III-associated protein domain-containing protein n=1 Tax=Caminibacter mediatlanticus TB-2 TaxID=391592 RepID=A0ABX5V9T3_9BACT|nr:RAMP superfamily CRISPR-associated protein [Caminibacter mediatlanticus]QCT94966.1 hypothetical protein FE773_07115 [Caminibacter mediatlanticus TB-2]